MQTPKGWGLAVPTADFCAQAAKLMKSLPPANNSAPSNKLPAPVGGTNARALAVCTMDGQVFVAGEGACSAQGALWPVLGALLPQATARRVFANQPAEEGKVYAAAQNHCSVSGAVAACSELVSQRPDEQPWERVARLSGVLAALTGSASVGFDMAAFVKTRKTGELAWATAYSMKAAGALAGTCAEVMELYLQLTSVQLTPAQAARLAAALACKTHAALTPSSDDAVRDMAAHGLVPGVAVFGGESGLVLAAVPKIGGIAFWCPAVSAASGVPVVAREFFKQLFDKFPQ